MLRKRLSILNERFNDKITSPVQHMEKKGFHLKKILGHGAFGLVVKIKNSNEKSGIAVKSILKNSVVCGELNIWLTLDHQNILKLVLSEYISCAGSFISVVFVPVFPTTFKDILLEKSNNIKLFVGI